MTRWLWWLLAYASLGIGLAGILVPGLPTVPFVLLAAYAAARGSQRLHHRLHAHPQFGPMIADWARGGAVSRRAKRLATLMMALCGGDVPDRAGGVDGRHRQCGDGGRCAVAVAPSRATTVNGPAGTLAA